MQGTVKEARAKDTSSFLFISASFISYFSITIFLGVSMEILLSSCLPEFSIHTFSVPVHSTFSTKRFSVKEIVWTVAGDRYFSCMPMTAHPFRMGQR